MAGAPTEEPHRSTLGRDPPEYAHLATLVVTRCFLDAGHRLANHTALIQTLAIDIQHELRTAYAAGRSARRG